MEAFILVIDTLLLVLVSLWCMKNDDLEPNEDSTGFFRYSRYKTTRKSKAAERAANQP